MDLFAFQEFASAINRSFPNVIDTEDSARFFAKYSRHDSIGPDLVVCYLLK